MAVTDCYPLLLGDMFAQPTHRPGFKRITIVSRAVIQQLAQAFDILIRNQFRSPHRTIEILMRQACLGQLHPPTNCRRRAPQAATDFGLSLPLICQQDDFQPLSMRIGKSLIDI
jgi:hypothetical protein